jgi:hypothetical protein
MLFIGAAFMIAIATINRPSGAWFKGYLSFFTTFATCYGKHLTLGWRSEYWKGIPLDLALRFTCCPSGSACRTTLGRVVMPFSMKSLLLLNCENITGLAIVTYQSYIFKFQREEPPVHIHLDFNTFL